MHDGGRRAIIAAFFANLGIAVSKFVGFLVTGSAGLAAESVHSLADTANQGLLMFGGSRASRGQDEDHPFGHERERYFWAFIVALILFSMGGLFALYEGINKLRHPHETESLGIALGILHADDPFAHPRRDVQHLLAGGTRPHRRVQRAGHPGDIVGETGRDRLGPQHLETVGPSEAHGLVLDIEGVDDGLALDPRQ